MSWHSPQSDWDIQYIPTRREARARRFLRPAGTSAEAELSVTPQPGGQKEAVWEAPCSWWGGFWQESLSQLHPAVSYSWGRAAPLVWESWLLLPCVLHGVLGSATVEHLRPQIRCHLWERARGAAGAALPSSSPLQEELGYQLLNKQGENYDLWETVWGMSGP